MGEQVKGSMVQLERNFVGPFSARVCNELRRLYGASMCFRDAFPAGAGPRGKMEKLYAVVLRGFTKLPISLGDS